jgi:hypothetical protein
MLISSKRLTNFASFHEITHKSHWTSHPQLKCFIVFTCLRKNKLSFNNIGCQIFTSKLYNLNYNLNYIIYKLKQTYSYYTAQCLITQGTTC